MEPRLIRRGSAFSVGAVLLVMGVLALCSESFRSVLFGGGLENEIAIEWLENRGKVAVIDSDQLLRYKPTGSQFVSVREIPSLFASLSRRDSSDLLKAMTHSGVRGLIFSDREDRVPEKRTTLRERLLAYNHISGLRCAFLSPVATLYLQYPEESLPPTAEEAIAGVVRGILAGVRPPRITSFPQPLRRIRNAEVMVSLRQGKRIRLWRSAKGNSIARALVAAASIARRRWMERESMMRDQLDALLPKLDIDVFLLEDDGTVLVRESNFVDRIFTSDHYVAYQWKGSWRYQVPDTSVKSDQRSAVKAYQQLFVKNDLPAESLQRTDLRLYRLTASLLARSPATVTEIRHR